QGDAQVERAVDHRDGLDLVGAAVKGAHAHAAQTDGRDLRTATAQLAHLHPRIPSDVRGSAAHPPTLFRWAPYGLISRGPSAPSASPAPPRPSERRRPAEARPWPEPRRDRRPHKPARPPSAAPYR